MNKKLAFDNRLCYERSVARQHAIHQQKMQAMVSTALSPSKVYLDNNEPTKQPHLGTKAKRMQLDKERQMSISLQNQRLASKMDHILHRQENALLAASSTYGSTLRSSRAAAAATGITNSNESSEVCSPRTPVPPSNPSTSERYRRLNSSASHESSPLKAPLLSPKKPFAHSPARVHMPGIRLDATQTPLVDCYLSPEVAIGRGAACNKRTLINRGVQKRQQERIAEENRRMKQRVEGQKPFYDTKKWDSDWQKTGQKFGHIRQNGTVGYLLPSPKTVNGGGHSSNAIASPRTLKARRNIKTSHGLPLIQHGTNDRRSHQQNTQSTHPSSRSRLSHHHHPPSTSSKRGIAAEQHQRERYDCVEDRSDDEFQVVELLPCVLLEATTRKGVQIQVEELQIELLKADHSLSSESDAGDRGLVIRGKWLEDVEGEHSVSAKTLERIAQEIGDLEIMIKLETVRRIPHVGNFPRLSVLLTEKELEKLLFRLIQRLNIEVFEGQKELVISMRPYRGNGAAAPPPSLHGDEAVASSGSLESESKQRRRPRTCPSTMPNSNVHSQVAFVCPPEPDDIAVTSVAASQEGNLMRLQLGSWLNIGKRRFGVCVKNAFYLVRISFSTETSTLAVDAVTIGATPVFIKKQVMYSANQVKALVQQLESQQTTRDQLMIQGIQSQLPPCD